MVNLLPKISQVINAVLYDIDNSKACINTNVVIVQKSVNSILPSDSVLGYNVMQNGY